MILGQAKMLKFPWGWRHLVFLTAGLILVQCSGTFPISSPTSQPTPSKLVETVYPSAMIETAYPPALVNPIPEQVMPYPAPPTQPPSYFSLWQSITDPQKLWSLKIPPDWLPGNLPGEYLGEDGFIKFSYLPEMAYMQQARRVCERLANSPTGEGRRVGLAGSGELDMCAMPPAKGAQPAPNWLIIHHPEAEVATRFARIEIGSDQIGTILDTLLVLPVKQDPHQVPATKEPPEWLNSAILPSELFAEETPVEGKSPGQGVPSDEEFKRPAADNKALSRVVSVDRVPGIEEINCLLEPFGHRFDIHEPASLEQWRLWHQDELLLDEISSIHPPVISASGAHFAMVVYAENFGNLLVQETGVSQWNRSDMPWRLAEPVFIGEELLFPVWDTATGQVQVRKGGETVYAFTALMGANNPVQEFTIWQNGWLMEVDGFLIQDGQILNKSDGYDELFGWQILNGQPFFFFRRGEWVGISYAGQALPLAYEDVYHGGCCGYGLFNPWWNERLVGFFALREGQWYHVMVGVVEDGEEE
jgi:hypothetical protein